MLKYYQEITIIPCAEIPSTIIMNKVYQRLHGILSNLPEGINIGVSFPQYNASKHQTIGEKIRLFGETEETLTSLNLVKELRRFEDYIHITKSIKPVPANHFFAKYSRVQPERSIENKARRFIKRHEAYTYNQAINIFKNRTYSKTSLPYLTLSSQSSGQSNVPIFVKMTIVPKESRGSFSSYGLSSQASVPFF